MEYKDFFADVASNDENTTVYNFTTDKFVNARHSARLAPNSKGEMILVVIHECHTDGGVNSFPYRWYKHGFTKSIIKDFLSVECYVYHTDGRCTEGYNPTVKWSEERHRLLNNYDWLLPVSDENKQALMREVARRFYSA